jgi:uncharacterized protein
MYTYSPLQSIILILYFSGQSLLQLAPYIIGGVILGEALKFTSWTKLVYKWVSGSSFISILIASMLGMISPLCTYGTVPVVLQLFRAGVNIAPLITFLSVSAMMNPQLFVLTWGALGPEIALARGVMVLSFGLLLGFGLRKIPLSWIVNPEAKQNQETPDEILNRPAKRFAIISFLKNVLKGLQFIGFYVVIGVVVSAVIDVILPKEWLKNIFQANYFLSLLIAAFLSVPLYACGGGVIPVIREFIANGLGKGAALAFLFVGPATRITPLMALATFLRLRFIVVYLMIVIAFALLIGLIYH